MITNPGQTSGIGRAWDRFAAPTERYRRPFRRWRRGRPFYAGLCVLLAAVEIPLVTQSAVGKLLSMGIPGISTLFISAFLAVFAVTVWFFPAYRVFSGIATVLMALLSLVATNLGGFFLGFLLAMLGGSFAVAWTPRADYTADTRRQRRAAAGTAETETTETVAEPVDPAHPAEDTAAAEGEQHVRDTEIIEHHTRPDEAGPAESGPAPEEE